MMYYGQESKRKQRLYKKILNALLIVLFVIAMAFSYKVYEANIELFYLVAILWIICVIVLLWFGNKFIFSLLDKRFSWTDHNAKRFFLQLFLSSVYSLLCINGTYYLFKAQTTQSAPELEQLLVLNVYGLLFIIPVLSINFGIYFMTQWKKAHLQSDILKAENLRTQLNSLKVQLDPHFLFNNLNVLSSLIEQHPKTAQEFLDKFTDVYRYVLQYKMEELVPVCTEIEFIEAYDYLLKKRFGDQLIIDITVDKPLSQRVCIPPLSLQMLVENAIKHNKISTKDPLYIRVSTEDDNTLVVQNTFQPKKEQEPKMERTGLENIRRRYGFLTETPVAVEQNDSYFTVRLPLLEMV